MKVVITGGAGFVGTNLSRHLLARGHDIKILDDLSSGLASNVPDGAQFIEGSIVDAQLVTKSTAGADAVVHLGARGSVPRSIKNPIDKTNSSPRRIHSYKLPLNRAPAKTSSKTVIDKPQATATPNIVIR